MFVLSIFVIVNGATSVGAVLSTSIPLVVNEGETLPATSLNTPLTIVIDAEPSAVNPSNTTLTCDVEPLLALLTVPAVAFVKANVKLFDAALL